MELNLSEDSKRVIGEILRSKDKDGNGVIDRWELPDCLRLVGFNPTPDEADFLQQHFDKSGDGKLEIQDIIDNLDVIIAHSVKGEQLMDAFEKFDLDGTGFIKVKELQIILTAKGEYQMSGEDADHLISELLKKYDENNDGKFSYSEFVRILMQDGLPTK